MGELHSASRSRWTKPRIAQAFRQAFGLALLLVLPCGAQNSTPSQPQQSSPRYNRTTGSDATEFDHPDRIEEENRLRLLNGERQKSMISDANKLLKLAAQLNAEVSDGGQDSLTPAQLKKVGEIEKLARSVKEKMSTSVRGIPMMPEPFYPVPVGRR